MALSSSRGGSQALRRALASSTPATSTLSGSIFSATSSSTSSNRRQFSATSRCQSKLGRIPLSVPPGVEVSIGKPKTRRSLTSYEAVVRKTISVKGPLGSLELEVPEFVQLEQDGEKRSATLSVVDNMDKHQKEMWGTSWSYLSNYIMGVSEGHTAILRLVGVGYRATVEERRGKEQFPGQKFLCLKLGFTHPVEEPIPAGVTVTTPQPTRILMEGVDKEAIMSFAGRVRKWRPPEPYKGKGVFINDQTIKLKSKKIK